MYDGPQIDTGYDISNYKDVYPPFGSLKDMDRLIEECHKRKLHVMLDLVISHTSDKHPWFLESRSSKDNPKRDWYFWRPAKYDDQGNRIPPNNWKSVFGEESAWQWDEKTEEYYLHLFTIGQPDLNWDNADMRKAIIEDAIVFWVNRGIDSFRVDAANMLSKPDGLPDAPVVFNDWPWQIPVALTCNGPHIHDYLLQIGTKLRELKVISAGELPFTCGRDDVLCYLSGEKKQLDMAFMFEVVGVGMGPGRKYEVTPREFWLSQWKNGWSQIQQVMNGSDAWVASFLESHDQARSISRFGNDSPEYRVSSGILLAMLQTTMSGTLFLYQGQEIGMVSVPQDFPLDKMKDVESNYWYDFVLKTRGDDQEAIDRAAAAVRYLSRFNARMPIPWDGNAPYFGFSDTKPVAALHPLNNEINVASQIGVEGSVLEFWKRMIKLRKKHANTFIYGNYTVIRPDHEHLFIYTKERDDDRILVVMNFSKEHICWHEEVKEVTEDPESLKILVSTTDKPSSDGVLNPYEGRILIVQ
jgi:alpha-glucosidase